MASRAVAAGAGGYLLAALATIVLSHSLPGATADAVVTATMLSFLVYAVAVIWVFAATSAARAWLGLGLATAFVAAVAVVLMAG